jgi:monothiol glutaredoxin
MLVKIKQDVKDNKVVLYMKGHKELPMCGYSARVCDILKSYNIEFCSRNVLDSEELRTSIKEFSNWPTLPQLYIDGEFIGGCDIITQLHDSGELKKLLSK